MNSEAVLEFLVPKVMRYHLNIAFNLTPIHSLYLLKHQKLTNDISSAAFYLTLPFYPINPQK